MRFKKEILLNKQDTENEDDKLIYDLDDEVFNLKVNDIIEYLKINKVKKEQADRVLDNYIMLKKEELAEELKFYKDKVIPKFFV